MKRIPTKIAVESICYHINGFQRIAIYDYENIYDLWNHENGTLKCEGAFGDIKTLDYWKLFASEVHGITAEDDTIIFHICTNFEQY